MQVAIALLGAALIVTSGVAASRQLIGLARRYRSVGALRLMSMPAASHFRVSLLLLVQGVYLLLLNSNDPAARWSITGLWVAVFGWNCAGWVRHWQRKRQAAAQ
jgi:uncharacterized membrane protein YhfC